MDRANTKTVQASYDEFKADFWQHPKNWVSFSLQMEKQRDLVSLKVLEKIYIDPGYTLSLQELQRLMRNITSNKMTIWNHIKKLEDLDLVEVVRGKPLFVYPRKEISPENIQKLVNRSYAYLTGRAL